jgi:hypothetical protein
MPAQVMRPEMNADHFTGLDHHHAGRFIGNWKNSIFRVVTYLNCITVKPVSQFLRDKHNLMLFAGFWFSQQQLSVLDVVQSEFKHLTNTHAASGHQFQDQTITLFVVLKMISSTVSFSTISQVVLIRSRYILRIMGESHGLD